MRLGVVQAKGSHLIKQRGYSTKMENYAEHLHPKNAEYVQPRKSNANNQALLLPQLMPMAN